MRSRRNDKWQKKESSRRESQRDVRYPRSDQRGSLLLRNGATTLKSRHQVHCTPYVIRVIYAHLYTPTKAELPSYTEDRWCDIAIAWLRNDGAASEPRESIFIVSKCIKLRYGEKERSQLRRASSALPIPLQIHSNNNNYTHNQLWVLIRRMKTHLSSTNRLETIACTTNLENF